MATDEQTVLGTDDALLEMFLEHCRAQESRNAGWCGTGAIMTIQMNEGRIKEEWRNGNRERAVAQTARWLFGLGDPYTSESRVWHEDPIPENARTPWVGTVYEPEGDE